MAAHGLGWRPFSSTMRHEDLVNPCTHVTCDQNTEKAMSLGMLQAPLSVVSDPTSEGDAPWKKTAEWVERGAEVRLEETRGRHGHTTRPMNAFMLYRSACLRRAQIWCKRNNQQFLSALIGRSWALERPEIRELFKYYAGVERMNHRKAHASYKFAPKRRKTTSLIAAPRRLEKRPTMDNVARPGIADTGAFSVSGWDSEAGACYQTDNSPLEDMTSALYPVYRPSIPTAIFPQEYFLVTTVDSFPPWTPIFAGSSASPDSSPLYGSSSRPIAEADQQYWTIGL